MSEASTLLGGIEGGGTRFVCAVGRCDAPPLAEASIPTTDPAATLAACIRFFLEARRRHGAIAALGLACFGPLQLRPDAADYGCLMATPKHGWSGTDLLRPLRAALGVPLALDTDVGAAALAEWRLGAGRGLGSLAYVTVGTGIGGACVPQWATARLMHAELGHVPLRRDRRDARFPGVCPFHGDCAEGLASGPAIRARWGCDLQALPVDHAGRALIAGYLGQLAAAITLMLCPERIVLGGGVMSDPTMLPRVRCALRASLGGYVQALGNPASLDAYLAAPGLGPRSGISGALLLARGAADAIDCTFHYSRRARRSRIVKLHSSTLRRLAGLALLSGLAMPALSASPCAALKDFRLAGYVVQIDTAQPVAAGATGGPPGAPAGPRAVLPAYCKVDGSIDKRTGRNGKPYGIGFSVALPDEWNGRFLFQGGGGLNGAVNPPTGGQFAGDRPALAQGFAIVSMDSGHKAGNFDATFMEDQQAALDFLYAALGKVTVVAREIVAQHYGKPADHSYFVGCSTGGREAMIVSQRYPGYFDGIVAGSPAMRTGYSNLGLRWGASALNAIAPKDAQGKPVTRDALGDAGRKLIGDAMLGACDALDGAKDGLLFAAPSCKFDPAVLACKGKKADSCLSAAQVAAVKKVMAGPKSSDGRQLYPGYLWDTGIINTRGGLPGVLVGPPIPEGPATGSTINVDAEAAQAHDGRSMAGDSNGWTNLSSFNGHGGKLIFFHGMSDAWFSALDTVQYYERLAADNAPLPLADWSRLFLVPGMGHCNGGERTPDRFNMVDAIVNWVENNRAPERIVATGASMPGESRPLCPYPAHAHYDGTGDAKDAASYSCRR